MYISVNSLSLLIASFPYVGLHQAGPLAVESLSRVPGLKHVSLVGCPLAAAGGAALAASLASSGGSSSGSWPALEELCISGTGLSISDTSTVFAALAAGGAPCLKVCGSSQNYKQHGLM
mgnify:CR=1 FL=1